MRGLEIRPSAIFPVWLSMACSAAFPAPLSPRDVAHRFDSLLTAGADSEARALCTGAALRMFPLFVEAQKKVAPFLDSAQSRDTVLEEKRAGKWTALKMVSEAVFNPPLMGLTSLRSVQAVHLFRAADGWKLAEFEELTGDRDTLKIRTGVPAGSGSRGSGPLFPVSRRAPERGADRLRLKVSLRSGDSLPDLPQGAGQRTLEKGRAWAVVEIRKPEFPKAPGFAKAPDSLAPNLASGKYLDLGDSLLKAMAAELRKGAKDDAEVTRRVYVFVSSSLRFRLGAELFGASREVLRRMEGDCSEAAVLTAALLRAEGIPSRVVLGFATVGRGVFIGHAWTEAFIGGRWLGVDAALRELPAGAGRLALLRLDGSSDMRVAGSNLMLKFLANLEIEIEAAWSGKESLKLAEYPGNAAEAGEFFDSILNGMGK